MAGRRPAPKSCRSAARALLAQSELDAALRLRFGYVKTGDRALDQRTAAGLLGLSTMLNLRTSVEPAEAAGLDLERDALELYPMIYFNVPENPRPLSERAIKRLNDYIRAGGAVIIDTRAGGTTNPDMSRLTIWLKGLDIPPLQTVPKNHVLTRSYYLIDDFPGRYAQRKLWVEQSAAPGTARGDGVARVFVGDADWASAWAVDENGRDLYAVDGGPEQREMAFRFGVNLVMYVLTGSYKEDQVHIPALLERLGERDETLGARARRHRGHRMIDATRLAFAPFLGWPVLWMVAAATALAWLAYIGLRGRAWATRGLALAVLGARALQSVSGA